MVVDYIMRLTAPDPSFVSGGRDVRAHGSLDYTNDIALLANSIGNTQQLFTALETNIKMVGLKINVAI